MPNIEIHGYGFTFPDFLNIRLSKDEGCAIYIRREAFFVKQKIEQAIKSIHLQKEAITTIFPSIAVTCDGKNEPAPFIRISNTKPKESRIIIDAPKKRNILLDTETLTLASFTPLEEMVR